MPLVPSDYSSSSSVDIQISNLPLVPEIIILGQFSSVTSNSFVTPWTAAHQASLSITKYRRLLRLVSIESLMPSNHLILCHPLLLLPSGFPYIRVFSNESVLHIRWPRNWTFSFSISPPNEYSRLISFRMDRLDLLAVQGTLESSPTPQFKSINSLVFSFLYGSTLTSIPDYWKNHSYDYMDLFQQNNDSFFSRLSRFVIAFLPRSKYILISC